MRKRDRDRERETVYVRVDRLKVGSVCSIRINTDNNKTTSSNLFQPL